MEVAFFLRNDWDKFLPGNQFKDEVPILRKMQSKEISLIK